MRHGAIGGLIQIHWCRWLFVVSCRYHIRYHFPRQDLPFQTCPFISGFSPPNAN